MQCRLSRLTFRLLKLRYGRRSGSPKAFRSHYQYLVWIATSGHLQRPQDEHELGKC